MVLGRRRASRPEHALEPRRAMLAAVLVAALGLRVGLAFATPLPAVAGDPAMYDEIALSLGTGHGFARLPRRPGRAARPTAVHPPAWPLLLAGAYVISGQARPAVAVRPASGYDVRPAGATAARWRVGRVLQAVLGTLAVALIAGVARRLWGDGVALVAAALAAVWPTTAVLGLTLLGEPLFVVLVLAALVAVLQYRAAPERRRWLVVAGALIGLATLVRNNGLVLLLPLGAGVWTARAAGSRRAPLAPLALIAVALAVIAPWTLRNALVLHAFVPVSNNVGKTLAGTYNAQSAAVHYRWRAPRRLPEPRRAALRRLSETRRSARLSGWALAYIRAHPLAVPEAVVWNTVRLAELSPVSRRILAAEAGSRAFTRIGVAAFGVLGLLALAGAATRRARAAPAFVWATPIALWASVVPFAVNFSRFRAPIDPFLLLLAALAISALAHRGAGRRSPQRRTG